MLMGPIHHVGVVMIDRTNYEAEECWLLGQLMCRYVEQYDRRLCLGNDAVVKVVQVLGLSSTYGQPLGGCDLEITTYWEHCRFEEKITMHSLYKDKASSCGGHNGPAIRSTHGEIAVEESDQSPLYAS